MSGVFADHRKNHEDEKSGTRRDSPFFSPTWSEMFLAGSKNFLTWVKIFVHTYPTKQPIGGHFRSDTLRENK